MRPLHVVSRLGMVNAETSRLVLGLEKPGYALESAARPARARGKPMGAESVALVPMGVAAPVSALSASASTRPSAKALGHRAPSSVRTPWKR